MQATIKAAESTLKKMADHWEEGYNYGQLGMRKTIRDRIESVKSILETKKIRKDSYDVSAAIQDAVSQIDHLKGKGIRNYDMIGQIILAARLFGGIRCAYEGDLRLRPQIKKDGRQIESIPIGEKRTHGRIRTPKCEHLAIGSDKKPKCLYPSVGYCGKATERVERILSPGGQKLSSDTPP